MSCNGCRVLRKGCSESCLLRPCLQWIDTADAQGHATVFVAKFFGRAGLMSFISNVPEPQRPALFQSLLYEACGRTINPVNGAAGLMSTGNWYLCQAAVETVLRGGTPRPLPELVGGDSQKARMCEPELSGLSNFSLRKRRKCSDADPDLDLVLSPRSVVGAKDDERHQHRRSATPSRNSEESATTNAESAGKERPRLLNLFV